MAGTYTPNDAITLARQFSHKIPADVVQAYVCDAVNSRIWTQFTWNWTLASLTAITCTNATQDYTIANSDFYRMAWARIVRTDLSPVEYREMNQKKHLSPEITLRGGLETIRLFSYEAAISKLRLDRAADVSGTIVLQIQGEYQKKPTKIDDTAMGTVLDLPDHYFHVFFEGVRWKLYELSDDPRAGVMKIDSEGNAGYTGQLGVFMTALFAMQQAEDLSDGEDVAYPENPLGVPRDNFQPRVFG